MQPAPGMPIALNFVQRLALALVSARLEPWLRERLTAAEFEAIRGLLAELLGRPVPPTIGLPAPDPAAPRTVLNALQRVALGLFSARLVAWLRVRLRPIDFEAIRPVLEELVGGPIEPALGGLH